MTDKMWEDSKPRTGLHGSPIEDEPYMVTVKAARIQGNKVLFDSEHRHQNYITLSINSATRERGLSHDWIHGHREIIQVAMSEAQWAAMISSLNFGSGVPATLQHMKGERIEQPELPEDKIEHFSNEMVEAITDVIARIEELQKGKHTKATKFELGVIVSHLRSNIPFVADSFDKHMEERVEKAKTEIEAHMNNAVQRAGLDALLTQANAMTLIEQDKED